MTAWMCEVADTLGRVVKTKSIFSGNLHGASLY